MHILLIHQSFVSLNEAGGTRHYELARYLVEQGHQVTVIASQVSYLTGITRTTAPPEAIDGLKIVQAYTYRALHRSFVHRVLSFVSFMLSSFWLGLSVKKVDVVWGTSPPIFQAVTAWALAQLKRARFLLEIRDLWPAFAIAVGVLHNKPLIRMSEWLERFLYRRADRVMVNSPGFIPHIQNRGAQRIDLVPNGADPRMFDPELDGTPFRQANQLENRFVALYAGAHGLSNDLGIVLAAARLLEDHPEIAIVLLGDGKEKPALLQQAKDLALQNVLFLPPLPKSAMNQALAGADACIAILKPIPLYATVYPNKVFDYMASGRPVVLAIDGVIRKVVEEAQAGIFIQPGDPQALAETLRRLSNDRASARSMGINGRRYIENHFDRAVLAGQLQAVLEKLGGKTER